MSEMHCRSSRYATIRNELRVVTLYKKRYHGNPYTRSSVKVRTRAPDSPPFSLSGNRPAAQRWATVGTGRRNFLPVACYSLRIRLATFVPSACTKADRLGGLFTGARARERRAWDRDRGRTQRENSPGFLHRGGTADWSMCMCPSRAPSRADHSTAAARPAAPL